MKQFLRNLDRKLRHRSLFPFLPFKYNFGKRRATIRATLRLLKARNARCLVETGTARDGLNSTKGDGASTIVFGLWASQNHGHLHSVDIDPEAIEKSQQAVDDIGLRQSVSLNCSDSIQFLQNFAEPVDFLYLDSYDYSRTDVEVQKASQQHHLAEFKAIENKLHETSIVLIDDCNRPGGGKGKLVIEYMKSKGWKIHRYKYQALLVREK